MNRVFAPWMRWKLNIPSYDRRRSNPYLPRDRGRCHRSDGWGWYKNALHKEIRPRSGSTSFVIRFKYYGRMPPSPVSGKVKAKVFSCLHPYRSPKSFSAFSFDAKGPKEKANKKKMPIKEISLLRERPRLRLWNPQTFEKVWSKLSSLVMLTPIN